MAEEKPVHFASEQAFRRWLENYHARVGPIWIRFLKKHAGLERLTYAQALDQALCFGWIDGQMKPWDDESWIQRWGPRRPRSKWSQRNVKHAERLTKAGLMTLAGTEEIKAAVADGRWQAAYPSPRNAAPPEDFLCALRKNKKALAFYESLNRTNIYSIVYRLHHAKQPETRARWMKTILGMLAEGRSFHPQARAGGRRPIEKHSAGKSGKAGDTRTKRAQS